MTRENLSSVCPTKLDSNQLLQLQRLARKMKAVAQSNCQTYLLKPAMRTIYSEIVALVIILLVILATSATSKNLFKEYYDSDENEQSYYLTCTQRTDALDLKAIATSSLQETNDEDACLESFNFSCVVSKLNVYLTMT